jgi:hypothetical protein
MLKQWTFRHFVEGELVETDLIECNSRDWSQCPESQSRDWSVVRDGLKVRAIRLSLPADPHFLDKLWNSFAAYVRPSGTSRTETPRHSRREIGAQETPQ